MSTLSPDIEEYNDTILKDLEYSESTVENIDFRNCHFKDCNFFKCTFDNCSFVNCTFENCDLSVAQVKGNRFADIVFKKSKVIGVDWSEKYKYKITLEFYNSTLNYSVFNNITLKKFKCIDSIAQEVEFTDVDLTGAIFTNTDLQDTNFLHANVTNANFAKSYNYIINPESNKFKNTKFSLPEALSIFNQLGIVIEN